MNIWWRGRDIRKDPFIELSGAKLLVKLVCQDLGTHGSAGWRLICIVSAFFRSIRHLMH